MGVLKLLHFPIRASAIWHELPDGGLLFRSLHFKITDKAAMYESMYPTLPRSKTCSLKVISNGEPHAVKPSGASLLGVVISRRVAGLKNFCLSGWANIIPNLARSSLNCRIYLTSWCHPTNIHKCHPFSSRKIRERHVLLHLVCDLQFHAYHSKWLKMFWNVWMSTFSVSRRPSNA